MGLLRRAAGRRPVRRVLAAMGCAALVVLLLSESLLIAAAVHLDMPATRRLVAATVSRKLSELFVGTIELERLDRLGLDGIGGAVVVVRSPDGVEVVRAGGLGVEVDVPRLLSSLAAADEPIRLTLDEVRIDEGQVDLRAAEDGPLRIAQAFELAPDPSEQAPVAEGARPFVLRIARIELGHTSVQGGDVAWPAEVDLREAVLDLRLDPRRLDVRLHEAEVAGAVGPSLPLRANLAAALGLPLGDEGDLLISVDADGRVGGASIRLAGALDGERVEATVEAPALDPVDVRRLLPTWPVERPLGVAARAWGVLPHVAMAAQMQSGEAELDLYSSARLAPPLAVLARLAIRRLDAQELVKGAPPSSFDLDVDAVAVLDEDGTPEADLSISIHPGMVAGEPLPQTAIFARLQPPTLSITGRLHEPDLPIELTTELDWQRRSVSFLVAARSDDLGRVRNAPAGLRGALRADAQGTIDFAGEPRLDVAVSGELERVSAAELAAEQVSAQARITGPASSPTISGTVGLADGRAGRLAIPHARLEARGPLRAPAVELDASLAGLGELHAATTVELGDALRFGSPTLTLRPEHGDPLVVSAGDVGLEDGNVAVRTGLVQGLGDSALVSVQRRAGIWTISVKAPRLDATRVAAFVPDAPAMAGELAMEAELKLSSTGGQGRFAVDARGLRLGPVAGASGHLEGTISDRQVRIEGWAKADPFGFVQLQGPGLELAGGPLDPAAWRRASGTLTFQTRVDLATLAALTNQSPLATEGQQPPVKGRLLAIGSVTRADGERLPDVAVSLAARELEIGGTEVKGTPPGASLGPLAAEALVMMHGASGVVDLAATVTTRASLALRTSVRAELPTEALQGLLRGSAAPLTQRLTEVPVHGVVWLPHRPMAALPLPSAQRLGGGIEALATLSGTVGAPQLRLLGRANGLSLPPPLGLSAAGLAADLEVDAHYDGERADGTAVLVHADRPLLVARGTVEADSAELLQHPEDAPWQAALRAAVIELPVHLKPAEGAPLGGRLTGQIALEGLHRDGSLRADLGLAPFGSLPTIGRLRLLLDAADGKLRGELRAEQPPARPARRNKAAPGGRLTAEVEADMRWGARIVPDIEAADLRKLKARVDGFRLAGLEQLLGSDVRELDGVLDGKATVVLGAKPRWRGTLQLRRGRLQLAQFGDRFDAVEADLTLHPGGRVELARFTASSGGGRVEGNGQATFAGTELRTARGRIDIPGDQPLPLVLGGQHQGHVSGRLELQAIGSPSGDELQIALGIPELRLDLPKAPAGELQSLEPAPHVRIGTRDRTGRPVLLDADHAELAEATGRTVAAHRLRVAVTLGNVLVARGDELRVELRGAPVVTVAEEVAVEGQIQIVGGNVFVQGKTFTLERGTVTFDSADPTNPDVVATARWTAADGTNVYVEFVGPVATGKVSLRSEPPRPRNEILALLLFGTADRNVEGAGSATEAVGLASGVATEGLNRGLQDLTQLDVATRVDTSRAGNPAPEIEVRIAQDLSLQFAHVLGVPPPGEHPDKNWTTVVWRFFRNWSVEATVGDEGSSMADLLWQYSY